MNDVEDIIKFIRFAQFVADMTASPVYIVSRRGTLHVRRKLIGNAIEVITPRV